MNFDEISKRFTKGVDQFRQYTAEKTGKTTELTEYPLTYRQLDEKVDQVKIVYDKLISITRQFVQSGAYEAPAENPFMDALNKVGQKFTRTESSGGNVVNSNTIYHTTAEICLAGAEVLRSQDASHPEDPPSAGLMRKYGQMMSKVGEAYVDFSNELVHAFINPFNNYTVLYARMNEFRNKAERARFELDSVKSKLRAAKPDERMTPLQNEVRTLEENFTLVCDEAIHEMHGFIQHADASNSLRALLEAQRTYHRRAADILSTFGNGA